MSEPSATRPIVGTLVVVAIAVGAVLGVGLWWGAIRDRAQRDEAQAERARRAASVVRILLEERIQRGAATVAAVSRSAEIREGLADRSRSGILKALVPFDEEFGATPLIVTDAEGRIMGWSSPFARWMLGEDGGSSLGVAVEPLWASLGGDPALLFDEPVEVDGQVLGWVRGATLAGRIFVHSVTEALEVPVVVAVDEVMVHHNFGEEPPLPEEGVDHLRTEVAGRSYDIGFSPLRAGGVEVALGAGIPREDVVSAGRRYDALLALFGIGGLSIVLVAVGVYLYVSEQRSRLIRQRDAERSRSEGLEDRLGHLTAVVHDIKAPVAGIQLRSEDLLEDCQDAELRSALERFVDTCERLNLYLINVLTAARAEDATLVVEESIVLVPGLVEDVVERVLPQARRNGIFLRTECSDGLRPLRADPLLLERALLNLAVNAVEVTPRGGEVVIVADVEDGELVLGTRDSGPGFRTFDPADAFRQERPTVKDASLRSGSTGFGLYIVGRIAILHGGRAEARNRAEGGAEVVLRIPLPPEA